MISIQGITKRYGALTAVDDLSFDVRRGEVVGFLGPNGAGKSTTMKVLTGSLQPDEGAVLFDGRSIAEDLRGARERVGYLPETNALYPEMRVSEYLEYAAELRGVTGSARRAALRDAVGQTGVAPVFTRPISELSKGFRQRVGLAAAILHSPEILVLDEPTEGLDPNQRVEIRRLITELGAQHTVILSTHVLAEVEATCDRLVIIHRGRLVADGAVDELVAGQRGAPRYVVEAAGDGVPDALAALAGVVSHESEPVAERVRVRLTGTPDADLRPAIFRLATERGWTLWELHRERASLEDLFRTLTEEQPGGGGGAQRDAVGAGAAADGADGAGAAGDGMDARRGAGRPDAGGEVA